MRIEPPPSVPSATGPQPLATATAAPPLEPPGVSAGFHGFLVTPKRGFSVTALWPNSDVLVFPMTMAPAALRRATAIASSSGTWSAERRATTAAPWGLSDRVWRAVQFPESRGWSGEPLTIFEALDWARIDRIPPLAEPGRLPPGGGTAVLNLIAELAREQGVTRLAYRGPYPTEQLFLALLESFRYEPEHASDPLTAFMAGDLAWAPAPHERLFGADGLFVQRR